LLTAVSGLTEIMRFETIKASAYLIWKLKFAGFTIEQDGGDIVLVRLPDGATASIHLIESPIPLYEIRNTLNYNQQRGHATLFVLWCDLLLPPEGHLVAPHDWEQALLALYQDRIYAFEIHGTEVYLFAVHFDREGGYRHIRYGSTLDLRGLNSATASAALPFFAGSWRVARFSGAADRPGERPPAVGASTDMAAWYDLLELAADADADAVKIAYRRLARRYHPDVNAAPDATARMQAINEAYEKILEAIAQR
jgi:hypothetical protein